jgi:hypothetical protein
VIKGLGGQHSAGAEHLLGAWQQWEGGGTANSAHFNPLNTTIGSYPKINSVGVSAFPDWQTGVAETVNTLSGYPAITEALRTGKVDFTNPALQADFNKWLTGKQTPGMTPYVAKIARSFGQDVPLAETRAASNTIYSTPPTAPVPAPVQAAMAANPSPRRITLMDVALGKKSILDMFFQKAAPVATPPAPAPAGGAAPSPRTGAGTPMVGAWTKMPKGSEWTKLDPGKWVSIAPGANREGVKTNPAVFAAVGKIAEVFGKPLTITTGTNHNQYVAGHPGRQSAHWTGNAADVVYGHGSPGNPDPALTVLGRKALVAAGMPWKEASKIDGGFFNVGGLNIGFNTMEGGNHYNHLHVGLES